MKKLIITLAVLQIHALSANAYDRSWLSTPAQARMESLNMYLRTKTIQGITFPKDYSLEAPINKILGSNLSKEQKKTFKEEMKNAHEGGKKFPTRSMEDVHDNIRAYRRVLSRYEALMESKSQKLSPFSRSKAKKVAAGK